MLTVIKSSVAVNGQLSEWFSIQRGCRQGDLISPDLFILYVEILATTIRQNKNIKGILIGETEYKISQYADDSEIMLESDKNSFEETVKIINTFGNKSGLFLNAGKTSGLVMKEIHPLNICQICIWIETHLNLKYLVFGLLIL